MGDETGGGIEWNIAQREIKVGKGKEGKRNGREMGKRKKKGMISKSRGLVNHPLPVCRE